MKGVATPQQRDYLLLTYNNNFPHHTCTVTPQPFCKFSHDTPTNDKHNSGIQMNSLNQSALRELCGTFMNGNVVIPKYSSQKVKPGTSVNYQWGRKQQKPKTNSTFSVLLPVFPKDLWIMFSFTELGFQQTNSDSAVDDGGQTESSH